MRPFDLLIPDTVDEALTLLADSGGRPIAGGTDLIPLMQADKLRPQRAIDLSRLSSLRGIRHDGDGLVRIGALTTHAQLAKSAFLWEQATALAQAARSVGGVQIRQRGTLGGNLVNASPAADVALALLAFEAQVTLRSLRGTRQLPLSQFLTGPGQTACHDDELLTQVSFLLPGPVSGSAFYKLGMRSAMIIAVVSVAAVLVRGNSLIQDARIALGSVAPTVIRAPQAEAQLRGQPASATLFRQAGQVAQHEARPIDDFRASAEYRRRMVAVLTRRTLDDAYAQTRNARVPQPIYRPSHRE
ncbi:MAG: xanthine dehydrogenase family protein subunit M [Anaerolineae bacterium]|nr:MAG: xanthine dehydrogenase family protein subunit M [Anaerolineae bacterium]